MSYYNDKPKFFFIEIIKGFVELFKKKKEKSDWWKENYKNSYDE